MEEMDNTNAKKVQEKEKRMGYMVVSSLEAALLKRLRRFQFGTWTVVKTDGEPRRIVEGGSTMLDPDEALELFEN